MKVATIGLNIAKQVFQVHGADKAGRTVLRRKLRRNEVRHFFSELEPCVVASKPVGVRTTGRVCRVDLAIRCG